MEETRYIEFDIPSIVALREDYIETIYFLCDELPDVNWSSCCELKEYFSGMFGIELENCQIRTLIAERDFFVDNECINQGNRNEIIEVLTGLIELKKVEWTCRNYLDNILKHERNGAVNLRLINGEWKMPNKQSLPYDQNIVSCIISTNLNKKEYKHGCDC